MTPPDERWCRAERLAEVGEGDRVVVLDLDDPAATHPLVMTGPAAVIWAAVDGSRTTAQVVRAVAADFGLPATEVGGDVTRFLAELEALGLLRREPVDP